MISIFNEQEIELLMSGLPNIDIEDLKANTEYHKYQANSLQVPVLFIVPIQYISYQPLVMSWLFFSADSMVLASAAVVRSGEQGGVPAVRDGNVESAAAGLQSVGRHERNAEVPDPSR